MRPNKFVCEKCGDLHSDILHSEGSQCKSVINFYYKDGYHLCEGTVKKIDVLDITTFEEFELFAECKVQEYFDLKLKPLIVKDMKRLKIKRINSIMGVTFLTMNNGKEYSDNEFVETNQVRKIEFMKKWISRLRFGELYRLINYDIDLTK
jgi:hypothetical protein